MNLALALTGMIVSALVGAAAGYMLGWSAGYETCNWRRGAVTRKAPPPETLDRFKLKDVNERTIPAMREKSPALSSIVTGVRA